MSHGSLASFRKDLRVTSAMSLMPMPSDGQDRRLKQMREISSAFTKVGHEPFYSTDNSKERHSFRSWRESACFPLFSFYHLLPYDAPSLWTIFFGVLSRILGLKRHNSGTPVVNALL